MKAKAIINLKFPSEKLRDVVFKALEPEARKPATPRLRAAMEAFGEAGLTLKLEASDTTALRAAVNSYLRWIIVINDTCSTLDVFCKQG